MPAWQRMRELGGVLAFDLPRYQRAFERSGRGFRSDPAGWISLCNRHERLSPGRREGLQCEFSDGSTLHAPIVWPWLGRRLYELAFSEWPIAFAAQPPSGLPELSFVFTLAGADRVAPLCRTIESINAQVGVRCECIVVDQNESPLRAGLPPEVRYHHLDKSGVAPGWHKAWGYNVGAGLAATEFLVFQDGDVCVPRDYAREILRCLEEYGAASLQRFLFYLDAASSLAFARGEPGSPALEMIRHNWKGGTIAIRREAFRAIGGFDEGFVDWGGEDDEFYDRCQLVDHCRLGFLPFVHLWHAPQVGRKQTANPNTARVLPWRNSQPREQRAQELRARRFGDPRRPDPPASYRCTLAV